METRKAIRQRRSIRFFKSDEIPENIIREILEEARWTPSWGNTQPWEFYVVTGETLKKFKKTNRQHCIDGISHSPEIEMPAVFPEAHKKRYTTVGKSVLSSLGIAREDKKARDRYYADMFNLFNAPCLIVICIDNTLCIEYAMIDVGLISQTICLLAHERGLGTCMLAAAVRYPKLLRELLPIPDNKIIVIGSALGYPDWDSPVNQFERERAALDELVIWVR